MGFLYCVGYAAAIGTLGFLLGRVLPKAWFRYDRAPFRAFRWEQGGRIYTRLAIQRWQSCVPDMSKVFPKLMPPKSMQTRPSQQTLARMLQETCVAEAVHAFLCVLGLYCLWLWPGWGGAAFYVVYVMLGNLPFILIQRYNRPRLARLYQRRQGQKEGTV